MRRIAAVLFSMILLTMIVSCSSDDPVTPTPTPGGTNSFTTTGAWDCALSESCQDVYELTFAAGSSVTVVVSSVTGNSVVRLALFAPGVALDGINLLMNDTLDRECVGQNETDSLVVTATSAGTYQLAVGRDWGSSAGFSGTYALSVTSPTRFTVGTQTSDDTASQATGSDCPFTSSYQVDGGWTCATSVSCQDVYDIDIQAGTQVSLSVTNLTGNSVPRLALFAPGVALSGTNLLTGSANDRECVGQDVDDNVVLTAPSTGTYRVAICRDWGSSAGASGTYRLGVSTDIPFVVVGQTVDDAASQAIGSVCPTTSYQVNSGWTCAVSVSCQDVYDLDIPAVTNLSVNVTNVTGNSVIRLAVFAPGVALNGTNLLNSSNNDRECVGQNANDSVAFIASGSGVYRLAVGRDWGSSAGTSGTYTVTVTADMEFVPLGSTSNNTASQAAGSQCP